MSKAARIVLPLVVLIGVVGSGAALVTTSPSRHGHATNMYAATSTEIFPPSARLRSFTPASSQDSKMPMLPVAVDGAVTPDQMPDWLASNHFIMAVTLAPDAPEPARVRRNALLSKVGLSDDDKTRLAVALESFAGALAENERAAQALGTASQASSITSDRRRQERREILSTARTAATSALTAEGAARLDSFIRLQVKRRIIVYGDRSAF